MGDDIKGSGIEVAVHAGILARFVLVGAYNDTKGGFDMANFTRSSGGDAVYGLGMIGALIYYIQQAEGLIAIIIALLKTILWPAFVVYDLLKFLA